jgi:hypothetical protein
LHKNALALGFEETLEKVPSKVGSMKSAIRAYFFLNDILLGQVLGDEATVKERIELINTLNNFQHKVKYNLFAQRIEDLKKKDAYISIDQSRALLRKQLNEFIGLN